MTAKKKHQTLQATKFTPTKEEYSSFYQINGIHPYQEQVPEGYVPYWVKKKKDGEIVFFNFILAKEMGLIPKDHPHQLNKKLSQAILDNFSIQIINEYDIIHQTPIPEKEIYPHQYMATRYLQLQHPNKQGKTSGDGRSLWNGHYQRNGKTWDISSCGTGATCLSPATAIHQKFFQTGDPSISYGCGLADLSDGLSGALMSEIFHRNRIRTERTLAIISYDKNLSINVRAGHNLLRPSHFFIFLKQNNLEALTRAVDYHIERQIINGDFPAYLQTADDYQRYNYLLSHLVKTFSMLTAQFEREYIFCWMDWDGDNILLDGGIIDYGSVRQFGLFHHKYRYDDTDRFSTTITEQRKKARYIVQTFIQMIDFLIQGRKKNIKEFSNHQSLKEFDQLYIFYKRQFLLEKIGFSPIDAPKILKHHEDLVASFEKQFDYFERKTDGRQVKVSDGITQNALYCMRDILREYPQILCKEIKNISSERFLEIIRSRYSTKKSLFPNPYKDKKIRNFQKYYMKLIGKAAHIKRKKVKDLLLEVSMRSSLINRADHITGNSAIYLADILMKQRKEMTSKDFHQLFERFIHHQTFNVEIFQNDFSKYKEWTEKEKDQIFKELIKVVYSNREGI
jgi:uncharacterized protein YdiU (UPF0061 family)